MFELRKNHRNDCKNNWKSRGMKFTDAEFEYIYSEYIAATNCDLCNKQFKSNIDRQLDHNHYTGEIRNIVCRSCNGRREDNKIHSNNKSGYKYIFKNKNKECKQGFIWRFIVTIDGKNKIIKSSVDKDKLIIFRDKWLNENTYNT